jgi:hypothetical protein
MSTPSKADDKKAVWMACRATKGCEGKYAILVWRKPVKDGMVPLGESFRYRCTTCQQPFHIRR